MLSLRTKKYNNVNVDKNQYSNLNPGLTNDQFMDLPTEEISLTDQNISEASSNHILRNSRCD